MSAGGTRSMVMIDMPKDGKNVQALSILRRCQRGGLGYAYLTWLIDLIRSGELPTIPDLPDRTVHAQRTAEWGYHLYEDFAKDAGVTDLPAYNGGAVRSLHLSLTKHPIIL